MNDQNYTPRRMLAFFSECVCVCVCVRARVCVCVCVSFWVTAWVLWLCDVRRRTCQMSSAMFFALKKSIANGWSSMKNMMVSWSEVYLNLYFINTFRTRDGRGPGGLLYRANRCVGVLGAHAFSSTIYFTMHGAQGWSLGVWYLALSAPVACLLSE